MARQTKQSAPAPAQVQTPVPTQVENVVVAEKAPKTPRAKKAPKTEVAAPVEVSPAPVASEPVSESAPVESSASAPSSSSESVTLAREQSSLISQIAALNNRLKIVNKALLRSTEKDQKSFEKVTAKKSKTKNVGNRKASGFVKPTLITNELADFLNKPHGTEMARTEACREINAYINAKGLKNKQNGRIIEPDTVLAKLLNVQPTDELSYFNLQKFMKHLFVKTPAPVATA
jgi:chromatin remodeling complex protein RSC6